MNKKFLYEVGNNKMLYYDARPTKYQNKEDIETTRSTVQQ
jgi:hypothetical protein